MAQAAQVALTILESERTDTLLGEQMATGAADILETLTMDPVVFKVEIECAPENAHEVKERLPNVQAANMVGLNPSIPGMGMDIFFKARVYQIDDTHFEVNYYCRNEAALNSYLGSPDLQGAIAAPMPEYRKNFKIKKYKGIVDTGIGEFQWTVL